MIIPTTTNQHNAAVLNKKGANLELSKRQTPNPGPNEVLIKVNSIAINPVDHIQQSNGFHIDSYPAVLGFDIAGTIHSIGYYYCHCCYCCYCCY